MNAVISMGKREIGRELASMFVGLLSPHGGRFTEALVAAYIEALAGVPVEIVRLVAGEYRTGVRGDGKFAPLPAEMGKTCRAVYAERMRALASKRAAEEQVRQIRDRQEALRARTPEEKARVRALVEKTKAELARASLEDKAKHKRQGTPRFYSYQAHIDDYFARRDTLATLREAAE